MPVTKKKSGRRSSAKKTNNKIVIVTKSTVEAGTLFSKKVKAMNQLLDKATLLP
jgi:ABC-type metal ion transport system substrate-binding protein